MKKKPASIEKQTAIARLEYMKESCRSLKLRNDKLEMEMKVHSSKRR